ncbi:hypothetical protein ACIBSV_47140 [Embleya sp. NPDC050154]|uniref:hypothetical protein n=1 Tax=Embleya sp. NPDC050154 TaxID=3363988 RepID=UPI0037897EF1
MSGGGFRPAARYVVLRAGSVVVGTASEWDPDKGIGYQTVTLALPNGTGTIELRAETRVAGAVANALAGLEPVVEDAPPTSLFTVKGGGEFGDLVIEAPVGITNPGLIATHLQERLTALTRPLIAAEHAIDWMVYLPDVTSTGPAEGFASLSIDEFPAVRYPLVEASRTEIGGAR